MKMLITLAAAMMISGSVLANDHAAPAAPGTPATAPTEAGHEAAPADMKDGKAAKKDMKKKDMKKHGKGTTGEGHG